MQRSAASSLASSDEGWVVLRYQPWQPAVVNQPTRRLPSGRTTFWARFVSQSVKRLSNRAAGHSVAALAVFSEEEPMSKQIASVCILAALAVAGGGVPVSATAADLLYPRHQVLGCGPCGCPHVSYVYHRELLLTYGPSFDPRDFDQTEPHYYFGQMRAYPRYWVDATPMQ
jgi:hypothetical protein